VPWSAPFELPNGRKLVTLEDARHYIAALPKTTQQRPEWQTAAKTLMRAAEGRRLLMFAYIGMMQALHTGKPEPPTTPRRKRAKKHRIIR
jgi:hypothetical protein